MGVLIFVSSLLLVLLYEIILAIKMFGLSMAILLIPWIGVIVLFIELDKRC